MDRSINDNTNIPITWLFAVSSCAAGVLIVAAGLIIWGSRLESRGDFRESRINKLEVNQEQYVKDISEIKQAIVRIQVLMERKEEKR